MTKMILPATFFAFLFGVGLLFLWASFSYQYWAVFGPGPGLFPRLAGIALLTSLVFVAIFEFRRTERIQIGGAKIAKIFAAIVAMGASSLAIPVIGMLPTLLIFIFGFLVFIDRQPIFKSLLTSVLIVIFIYCIFVWWLGSQFPEIYFEFPQF